MENWSIFWEINILLALFYMPYVLWLRHQTFHETNRIYLLGVAIGAILLPLVPIEWLGAWLNKKELPLDIYVYNLPVNILKAKKVETIEGWQMAAACYWWIAAFLFIRFLYLLIKTMSISQSNIFKKENAFAFFGRIEVDPNLPEAETLYFHERIHKRQLHALDLLLFECLCIIFWANPILYFYRKSIRLLHEYIADYYACQMQESKANYAQLLFNQQFGLNEYPKLVQYFSKTSTLKLRIMMLSKKPSSKIGLLKYSLIVPLVVATLALKPLRKADNTATHALNLMPKTNPDYKKDQTLKNITVTLTKKSVPKKDTTRVSNAETVFTMVDQKPSFPGGDAKMYAFMGETIKYPKEAIEAQIKGMVWLKFIIEKDGQISNVEVAKGIGYGCDEEAVRVIKAMPIWQPGYHQGKAVRVMYNLPIAYSLD